MRNEEGWEAYDPAGIPTKAQVPHIEHWLSKVPCPAHILDVGCGTGGVSRLLHERGYSVTGIDINPAAIANLSQEFADHAEARFFVRNLLDPAGLDLGAVRFGGAVCQLVASVIGNAADRERLLQNIREALGPAAKLTISFSGLSGDINPEYAKLYEEDFKHTGEFGTYLSRDEAGRVLYQTHHFASNEIRHLLQNQNFHNIEIEEKLETSSRRPNERARFYYVSCEAP